MSQINWLQCWGFQSGFGQWFVSSESLDEKILRRRPQWTKKTKVAVWSHLQNHIELNGDVDISVNAAQTLL